jgi:glycosyltransferase involved in cell wall biosynthesis
LVRVEWRSVSWRSTRMSNAGADDVTVVIPTRGQSPFLREAVESAVAQRPAEVIVVEDGGNPAAPTVLPEGARLLHLESVGRSEARNAGASEASTPFVAFLDDDDLALPLGIARLRRTLEGSPSAALAFGRVVVTDGSGKALHDWNALLERRFRRLSRSTAGFASILETRCPIYTSATMVRRESFLEVGGYDGALDSYEDLDLYLRLARRGPLTACSGGEPVAVYRLHGGNTASERLYEGALAVTSKHLGDVRGREHRLLVEWQLDALWGLGRFHAVRREGASAASRDPLLLARPRFAKRFVGSLLPGRLLARRR